MKHLYIHNSNATHGNLNSCVGSLGFATVIKLEPAVELVEPPEVFEGCIILTDSSSSSLSSLGRSRAAIRTLADAIAVDRAGRRQKGGGQLWWRTSFVTCHIKPKSRLSGDRFMSQINVNHTWAWTWDAEPTLSSSWAHNYYFGAVNVIMFNVLLTVKLLFDDSFHTHYFWSPSTTTNGQLYLLGLAKNLLGTVEQSTSDTTYIKTIHTTVYHRLHMLYLPFIKFMRATWTQGPGVIEGDWARASDAIKDNATRIAWERSIPISFLPTTTSPTSFSAPTTSVALLKCLFKALC